MGTVSWLLRRIRSLPLFDPPVARINKASEEIARDIDTILYSGMSAEEMLSKLAPYIAVGEHARLFVKRTGLQPRCGFVCGPYPTDYEVPGCGLELVLDDLYKVHVIRRAPRRVGDIDYPQQSISAPIMSTGGYTRVYNE